jgi:hypothetical protein
MKITLSKALKLKNKLVEEFNTTLSDVTRYNSTDVDETSIINASESYEKAKQVQTELINLKTQIHSASAPVRSKIFELGETKSLLGTFKHLTTRSGVVKESGYSGSGLVRTYAASIDELTKRAEIKRLEVLIETLQDELDVFNASTLIEL